ncbi:MAG TPA: hypothetical protein VNM91_08965 [Dehalococcoidia bacterium]|nr:hypothetical protein [Dehalococcoidia bacterium]
MTPLLAHNDLDWTECAASGRACDLIEEHCGGEVSIRTGATGDVRACGSMYPLSASAVIGVPPSARGCSR